MIGTFIRRPVFTTMFVLLLVVFGIKSYPNLGVDLYPDVELPLVSVTVTYTGASPEEMETLITRPIEDRVSQVAGIKTLSSTVREGYSQTTLEFELGVDPREMASEVREKVASVRRRLPDDIDEPVVQRFDISSQSIAAFTFASLFPLNKVTPNNATEANNNEIFLIFFINFKISFPFIMFKNMNYYCYLIFSINRKTHSNFIKK